MWNAHFLMQMNPRPQIISCSGTKAGLEFGIQPGRDAMYSTSTTGDISRLICLARFKCMTQPSLHKSTMDVHMLCSHPKQTLSSGRVERNEDKIS